MSETATDRAHAAGGGPIDPDRPTREQRVGAPEALPVTVIQPRRGWIPIDWKELWEFRELLYFLVWRDVKVRYKQTVLGATWAILQPLVFMLVFTLIAGLTNLSTDGVPKPVFYFAGLVPWLLFANAVSLGGQSLVNQQHLLTKVYFPRLFVPIAPVGAGLLDFLLQMAVLVVMMAAYGMAPSALVLLTPLLLLVTLMAGTGMALLLGSLTVTYRDFRYVIPYMVQVWMFVSPVIYSANQCQEKFRETWGVLPAINPMWGVVTGFRAALVGTPVNATELAISTASAILVLLFGAAYFRRTERRFADVV
ncbi:MAG TPA: ABC transporter permease [Phycisphaerae bacterium]|nr:ABC transporter permease [Phycisphaerae bacterium]